MRIVFFGTPEFAASVLDFLLDSGLSIAAVVTQPDRPKGRSLQAAVSSVKEVSEKKGIPILQPIKASDRLFLTQLKEFSADLFVVVAFGQILPQELLDIPAKGCINLHASLLPKYRGAAPMQRALIAGDGETGICIQKMVKQLDAGDVIASARIEIGPDTTFGQLNEMLCELSKPLLLLVLKSYEEGEPFAEPQDHSLATYATKISTEETEIDWNLPAEQVHNRIRAFSPKPGAWSWAHLGSEKKRVKILRSQIVSSGSKSPGTILSSDGLVSCGSGYLQMIEVQPEGKKIMQASDWLRGCRNLPHFEITRK